MPERAFVIHFPNGDFEYDVRPTSAPEVGDTVRRRGALWRVTTRDAQSGVVSLHVEAVDHPFGGPPGSSPPDAPDSLSAWSIVGRPSRRRPS